MKVFSIKFILNYIFLILNFVIHVDYDVYRVSKREYTPDITKWLLRAYEMRSDYVGIVSGFT